MTDKTDVAALIHGAQLAEARAALVARVKAAPAEPSARLDLVDVLILLGEWEKADTHADLAGIHDPARAVQIALTRQLIRAAAWRDDCFSKARPPELVTEPDVTVTAALARLTGRQPDEAEVQPGGIRDGQPFALLRDADDRTAGVLEVLTSTGKYLWVPFASIASLRPARPERVRDLVWRPAELEVANGPTGIVYLPATYHAAAPTDAQRMGRDTDWIEQPDGSVTGVGARLLLIDDDLVTFDGFEELAVAAA
jgi:type VI secretion system protein ImpE